MSNGDGHDRFIYLLKKIFYGSYETLLKNLH
jgi:hypothetical protein